MHQPALAVTTTGPIRRTLSGLIVTVLLGIAAVVAGPTSAAEAAMGRSYENSFAHHTNQERAKRGLVKLKWGKCLDRYAEAQARRMAMRQQLEHQNLGPILRSCDMRMVGENIAVGYPNGKSVTRAWMKSSGHRASIVKKQYRRYGAGAYRDSDGRWWVAHVFGRRA